MYLSEAKNTADVKGDRATELRVSAPSSDL